MPLTLSTTAAIALQEQLRHSVVRRDAFGKVRYVAGADVAFDPVRRLAYAAVLVFRFPSLEEVERSCGLPPDSVPLRARVADLSRSAGGG